MGSAAVADIAVHSCDQESDFILRPTTEATLFLCLDSDRDYWMTAQEAKEYGMIDEVLIKK